MIVRLALNAIGYALIGAALLTLIAVQQPRQGAETNLTPARHEAVLP